MMVEMTPEELDFITNSRGMCPVCRTGELMIGPQGCSSRNVKCAECKKEFSVTPFGGRVLFGEHLNRDAPEFYGNTPFRLLLEG